MPIDITPEVATQIAPHLPPACILADITSLKLKPLEAMLRGHRRAGRRAASAVRTGDHYDGQANCRRLARAVIRTSANGCSTNSAVWGNVLVETSAAEHDEIMGIVQALRHFATFAFGQFLHSRHVPIPRTLELSSPIYRLELAMVGRLFAQDPSLYAEIVFATPERLALLKDFIQSLQQNLDWVERGDKAEFVTRFRKVAEWFGPFSEQAMRESTFLVEKLVHRF